MADHGQLHLPAAGAVSEFHQEYAEKCDAAEPCPSGENGAACVAAFDPGGGLPGASGAVHQTAAPLAVWRAGTHRFFQYAPDEKGLESLAGAGRSPDRTG